MKMNILLSAILLAAFTGLSGFSAVHDNAEKSITFAAMVYDFGKITKGMPVSNSFEFRNTAGESITITKVAASCGCTVTDYTRERVEAGKSGYVKATYNAAKAGVFSKTISVFHSGTETPIVLTIKGEVVE